MHPPAPPPSLRAWGSAAWVVPIGRRAMEEVVLAEGMGLDRASAGLVAVSVMIFGGA